MSQGNTTGAFNPYMTFGERKEVIEKFRRILADLFYKRGWEFNIAYDLADGEAQFCMSQLCEDVNVTGPYPKTTKVGMVIPIPLYMYMGISEEDIVRGFIRGCILQFEEHEVNEWLHYRGHHVVNPHPENPWLPKTP